MWRMRESIKVLKENGRKQRKVLDGVVLIDGSRWRGTRISIDGLFRLASGVPCRYLYHF